jgi:hypothetical protein
MTNAPHGAKGLPWGGSQNRFTRWLWAQQLGRDAKYVCGRKNELVQSNGLFDSPLPVQRSNLVGHWLGIISQAGGRETSSRSHLNQGVRLMPFREVASSFQPEELDKLKAAFDAAWQQLLAVNGGTEAQIELLRKQLAQHILASACTGQRDVEIMKDNALRALMKRRLL